LGLVAVLALLAASLVAPPVQDATTPALLEAWKDTWTDLARFAQSRPGSPEHDRLWQDLDGFQVRHESSAKKRRDRVEQFRARLLRAHLSRLSGIAVRPLGEPGTSIQFLPGEAWLTLEVAGPGPTRVQALRGALAEASGDGARARVDRGLAVTDEDARELHLDLGALRGARPVREVAGGADAARARARVPAAGQRRRRARAPRRGARERRRPGRARRAARREGRPARTARPRRPRIRAGSRLHGRRVAPRDAALSEREFGRARALFRSLLDADPAPAPSLRGYGIALLSSPAARP
jgi:hypothetical protein